MFKLTILPDDREPFTVTAGTRDVMKWEKNSGKSVAKTEDLTTSDLYELAYYAAKRLKLWDGTQADLEETCDLEAEVPGQEPNFSQKEA